MFNFVRLSDGGPARHTGPRSEVETIAGLAIRVLGPDRPIDWRTMESTHHIRDCIAQIVPGYEQIATIDQTKREFQIDGRTLHDPRFPTADGRARLKLHQLPELAGSNGQLRLMTVRSEGQFNTVVFEDYDLYRGQDRRDVILIHPDDIARLGLRAEQRVTVSSEVGEMPNVLVRPFEEIKPGNVLMYYPEANALVPRHTDPASKTPAFKSVLVRFGVPARVPAPAAV